jgi:hypothetical protein
MPRISLRAMVASGAFLLAGPLLAAPHGHAHGKAEMELTVQDGLLRAVFRTPMDSLLGFEHAPKTETQKLAVSQLKNKLANPAQFFVPSPAAQCTPNAAEASSTLFTGQVSGGHSDLEYRFGFKCTNAKALAELDAVLFADYPRLHEIRALVVTNQGQRSVTVKKRSRRIGLN